MRKEKFSRLLRLLIVILFFFAFFIWQVVFANISSQTSLLEVDFFDVGEGDSVLLSLPSLQSKFGERIQLLIDGGPSGEIVEKVAKEMPFFDRKIEILILTHPDKDHITGLFEILRTFKIDKVLLPKIEGPKQEKDLYLSFLILLQEKNIEPIFTKRGHRISFPDGTHFLIFWPEEDFISKNTNDFSIVTKFSFGKVDFLFTGDLPKNIEYKLLTQDFNLESEILKVAHHGSKNSTSEYFLEKISPEIAVICVGENSYGHPAREVLELLSKYDIKVLRTDFDGDIKIISDGKGYQIIK